MKTFQISRSCSLATALLSLAALCLPLLTASAKDNRARQPRLVSMFAKENQQEIGTATEALAKTPDAWNNIKDYPYEKRQDFTAVFSQMVAKFDDEIRALNEKRANMKNDTKDWDFAMKELNNARSDVQSKQSELSRVTTPDAWTEAKDRLGVAWERAQTACEKVKASTTS